MKKLIALMLSLVMVLSLAACGSNGADTKGSASSAGSASGSASTSAPADASGSADASSDADAEALGETTIYIDIAASLEAVFRDVILPAYAEKQPNVKVEYNTGSSGKLLSQIEEANGIGHDLFFSAGKKQVTTLDETDGLVVAGSVVDQLSNELCLVKGNDTEAIKADTEALEKAFYPLAEKLYQSAQSAQGGADAGNGPQTNGDGTYYNADFEDKSDK